MTYWICSSCNKSGLREPNLDPRLIPEAIRQFHDLTSPHCREPVISTLKVEAQKMEAAA